MTKICREAEASLDYYAMFKNILKQASARGECGRCSH